MPADEAAVDWSLRPGKYPRHERTRILPPAKRSRRAAHHDAGLRAASTSGRVRALTLRKETAVSSCGRIAYRFHAATFIWSCVRQCRVLDFACDRRTAASTAHGIDAIEKGEGAVRSSADQLIRIPNPIVDRQFESSFRPGVEVFASRSADRPRNDRGHPNAFAQYPG